jgi:RNA polymerase sigma factor (sigma-70 family)
MAFPDTSQSALLRLHDEDELVRRQSYEAIIAAYWSPVYGYLRRRWRERDEDSADLTQSFFSKAIEAGTLLRYDPSRAAFRTYLRICLDNFVINARREASRRRTSPLNFDVQAPAESPEELFRQEWIRSLFGLAIEDLKNTRDDIRFRVFELYDLNELESRPTYADLAKQFGTTPERITNYLAAMRRDFRKAVLNRLRDITATEREFQSEARAILGVEV